jgi:hypothetical protein
MIPYIAEPFTPETNAAIEHAQYVFEEIVKRTPDGLDDDDRSSLLMAFGSVAMEHYRSIVMMCRSGVATGSALALFRPLLDSIVRGEWLYFCADEDQINRFMRNDFNLHSIGFSDMARAVDEKSSSGIRFGLFVPHYAKLCDYTHTGHDAVVHRIAKDGGIEPTYPESRIRALVSQSSIALVLHYEVVYSAKGDQSNFDALAELFDSIPVHSETAGNS